MFTAETKKATITNAVGNGTQITYTATNTFAVGDIIHISGIEPYNLNIPDAVVATRSGSQFTVLSDETGTRTSGGVAVYDALKNHLATTSVINTQTKVIGEWNLNAANNLATIGNYRYDNDGNPAAKFTGIEGAVVAEESTVVVDSTANLVPGQAVYQQVSGYPYEGSLSTSAIYITSIDPDGVTFTVSEPSEVSGFVVFDVDQIPTIFIEENANTVQPAYYGATDSDVVVDGGLDGADDPYFIKDKNEKQKMLYSLEDCFGKFRPRSGINKAMYLLNRRFGYSDSTMATRPRYYASSRYDTFKYWTSFRKVTNGVVGQIEDGVKDTGISFFANNVELDRVENLIKDTAPFVVYRNPIAANRIIVKMQTHVGSSDPENSGLKEVPGRWSVEKLTFDNQWTSLVELNINDIPGDPNYVDVPNDGYIEFEYGVDVPLGYEDVFYHAGEYANANNLPLTSFHGYSYLVGASTTSPGNYYVWDSELQDYVTPSETASYSWKVGSQSVGRTTPLVTDTTNPQYFEDSISGQTTYREFDFMQGLRLVIHSMVMGSNKKTFDLIELSPRLAVDLSDKTTEFSITKMASDLGNSGMPVGQLLSSTGKLSIFDYDQAFNPYNAFSHETKTGSILNGLVNRNLQVKFYEITKNVGIYDYYMPIKTMYANGFPESSSMDRMIGIELKDQFVHFESVTAPELFIPEVSLSFAISSLLDSIGFSNYSFKRVGSSDPTIPFFFVAPDTSVAEVLNSLAVSTQHAMFFDEYNNFIVMSNDYMLPSVEDRDVDAVLYGSKDYTVGDQGVRSPNNKLSNIVEIKTELDDIYNDGRISYKARSIQKDMKELKQSYAVDEGRTYVYKPVLLWEAKDEETTKSINEQNNRTSGYALTAIPLNTDLSENVPIYVPADVSGLTATLTEGLKTVTVASTENLYAGQTVSKISGEGTFGNTTVTIVSIDSATQFTVSISHISSGSIIFKGNSGPFNHVLDLGQGAYWVPRYNGYFYANGEIIRYDAVEYIIEGLDDANPENNKAWLTSVLDYKNYFSKIKFGKKIYPSGRVRIYSKLDANLNVVAHGRGQFGTDIVEHRSQMDPYWSATANRSGVVMKSDYLFGNSTSGVKTAVPENTIVGTTGKSGQFLAKKSTTVTNKIKNVLITIIPDEKDDKKQTTKKSATNGTVQASALVMQGPSTNKIKAAAPKTNPYTPRDFISYVYKPLSITKKYVHFGTRLRIIGKIDDSDRDRQIVYGNTPFYTAGTTTINGGSGGIAIMLNPETNSGYYFEISALSYSGRSAEADDSVVDNVFFYKLHKDPADEHELPHSIPVPLFTSQMGVLADDGEFVGQSRTLAEQYPTVYDLAVEYVKVSSTWIRFYLYINGKMIATIDDDGTYGPILPIKNNMALFSRGSSKVMFENVYALGNTYAFNPDKKFNLGSDINPIFKPSSENTDTATAKYALSGIVKESFLGSVNPASGPSTTIYYDEFGTIMREAAYFNVKFDKAYPALLAKMAPTINTSRGHIVSGFSANAYGAEFMVFNATDTVLNLDSSTGNYLRIQGVAFNQEANNVLTVDEYYNKLSDFSNPTFSEKALTTTASYNAYVDIKNSRTTYGLKSFSLEAEYLQTQDDANKMMEWLMKKISKPRRAIGVSTFGTSYIQLGDILKVDYVDENNIGQSSSKDARYVVYSIDYKYGTSGPETIIYLSEVS